MRERGTGMDWERGNRLGDVKGNLQAAQYRKGDSTDAPGRGGTACSSDEAPVMGVERRGCIIQLCFFGQP